MTITIPDDLYAVLQQNAMLSGISVDDYLAELIRYAASQSAEVGTTETDEERAEIDAAIEESIAELERGESVPWEEVRKELRARYGL